MPGYSTTPDQPSSRAAQDGVHVPFVAHIRIVPDLATGKRWSYYRNMEKLSLRVERDLKSAGFNIATPIAFTNQFGDFSARLTVVGFVEKSRIVDGRKVESPTTDVRIIHSGTDPGEKTAIHKGSRGGSLYEGQDPTSTVEAEVVELRALLAAASNQYTIDDITHIEYNGVKYGLKKIGGRSFKV